MQSRTNNHKPHGYSYNNNKNRQQPNFNNNNTATEEKLVEEIKQILKQENFIKNNWYLNESDPSTFQFPFSKLFYDKNLNAYQHLGVFTFQKVLTQKLQEEVTFDTITQLVTPNFKILRNVIDIIGIKSDKQKQFIQQIIQSRETEFQANNEKSDKYDYHNDGNNIYIAFLQGENKAWDFANYLLTAKFQDRRIDHQVIDELQFRKIQLGANNYISNPYYAAPIFPNNNMPYPYQNNPFNNQNNHPKPYNNYNNNNNNSNYNNHNNSNDQKKGNSYYKGGSYKNQQFTGQINNSNFPDLK